jgi:hypothetical protein
LLHFHGCTVHRRQRDGHVRVRCFRRTCAGKRCFVSDRRRVSLPRHR